MSYMAVCVPGLRVWTWPTCIWIACIYIHLHKLERWTAPMIKLAAGPIWQRSPSESKKYLQCSFFFHSLLKSFPICTLIPPHALPSATGTGVLSQK